MTQHGIQQLGVVREERVKTDLSIHVGSIPKSCRRCLRHGHPTPGDDVLQLEHNFHQRVDDNVRDLQRAFEDEVVSPGAMGGGTTRGGEGGGEGRDLLEVPDCWRSDKLPAIIERDLMEGYTVEKGR